MYGARAVCGMRCLNLADARVESGVVSPVGWGIDVLTAQPPESNLGRPSRTNRMYAIRAVWFAFVVTLLSACASRPQAPDAEMSGWWATTGALSGDEMEGRDTGSAGYDRAAAYTADRFRRAGLVPAGEGGSFFQRIEFDEVAVVSEGTSFSVNALGGESRALRFLHEISVSPTWEMVDRLDAPLVYRGYCAPSDLIDVRGAVVVCFGTRRTGQALAAAQLEAATAAGAVAMIRVDDVAFTIEPPRWPLAYARQVVFADDTPRPRSIPSMRLSASAFASASLSAVAFSMVLIERMLEFFVATSFARARIVSSA